ncbi:MAG: sulfurase [Acidimicrobiia bacterium]|nr:sulfurase [Acidimicrobiia bacterium]
MTGRTVVSIHVSPSTRLPMKSVQRAQVQAGRGIEGDRYENTRHRHVSVQSTGELAEASARFGATIEPGLTRRNITVTGGGLPRTPGHRITVGEVELEVVRDAAPCRIMDFEIGEGARAALRRRGGVICRVLSGATIDVGASVAVAEEVESSP